MKQPVTRMTTAHLASQLEAVVIKYKSRVTSIEAKQEFVLIAKEWMSRAEVVAMDQKFNEWNSAMAQLVQKHNLQGIKT